MTMSSRPVQMPSMMMLGALLLAGAGAACGGNKRAPVRTDAAASTGGASGAGGSAGSAGVGGAAGSAGAGGAAGAGTAGSGGGSAGQGGGGGGTAGAGGNAGAGGSSPADPAPDAGTADAATSDATDATTATDATDASAATDATDAGTDVGTDAGTDTGTDAGSTDAGTCGNVRCPKLFTLVEACRPVGACTRSTGAGFPPPERLCYANGVKVRTMGNLTAFPPSQTVSWTYPDGNPCYSLDLAPQIVGGGVALTWKSPTDPLIARGTLDSMGNISITCEGETRQLTDNACAPPTSAAGCTAGTCE